MSESRTSPARTLAGSPFVHLILFAAYPVVFLWAQNLQDDPPLVVAVGLIGVMIVGALGAFGLAMLVLRDARRAAFVASALIGSFTAYGRATRELGIGEEGAAATRFLGGWLLVTAALVVTGALVRKHARGLTKVLNVIAAVLVALNLVPIVAGVGDAADGVTAAWPLDTAGLRADAVGPARDVYYLIFDRYAGAQTLEDLYGFDDTPFLDGLEARGFTVVHDAFANYPQTTHSLASSLNLTYLDALAAEVGTTSPDWGPLRASLDASTLSRTFQALGYRYVHMGSWWAPTWDDATADVNYVYGGLSEFSQAYWETTMMPTFEERLGLAVAPDDRIVQWHRVQFQVARIARDGL